MIEEAATQDEDLMIKFIEGEEITADELKVALRKATIDGTIIQNATLCVFNFIRNGNIRLWWIIPVVGGHLRFRGRQHRGGCRTGCAR